MDLDGNAVNTALDYILLNFRILKAAVDPPVCVCGVVWCVVCGVWSGLHCHVPRRPDRTVGWSNGFRLLLNYTAQCPRRYVSKNAEMLRTKKGLTSKFAWRNGFFYCFTTPTVYYFSTQKKIVY